MSGPDPVSLEILGEVGRLTLRHPPLNFLTVGMLKQIEERLDSLGTAPSCRVLILDSEGNAFSTGFELSELTKEGVFLLLEQFHHLVMTLLNFPRPTVAVVRGMAVGAGNELAAACDFVFASEKALFGQPEVKVGGIPSIAHLLLPALIGQRRTSEMILTGNLVGAREAERAGLIQRCLADEQLGPAVDELVKNLSSLSTSVLEVAVQAARQARVRLLSEHLREAESLYLDQLMETEDQAEGVRAFQEKRQPKWKNR